MAHQGVVKTCNSGYAAGYKSDIMRYQDDAHLVVEAVEQSENIFTVIGVDIRGRFIEQQQFRFASQCTRNENALALPPRRGRSWGGPAD
jgi:hypothetical protein